METIVKRIPVKTFVVLLSELAFQFAKKLNLRDPLQIHPAPANMKSESPENKHVIGGIRFEQNLNPI